MRHLSVSKQHRLTIFCAKNVRRPSRKLSRVYLMTLKPLQTHSDTGNVNSAWADDVELPPAAACTVHPFSSAGAHPLVIKPRLASTVALIIYPPLQNPSLALFSPDLLYRFFIYLCYLALALFLLNSYPTMVTTRTKNKTAHPATPVMTEPAKKKAGIKAKPCKTKTTKKATIKELRARIAALEDPNGEPFSKEPLVHTAQLLDVRPDSNANI